MNPEDFKIDLEEMLREDWRYSGYREDSLDLEDYWHACIEDNARNSLLKDDNPRSGDLVTWRHNWNHLSGKPHPYGIVISIDQEQEKVQVLWGESSDVATVAKKDLKICN